MKLSSQQEPTHLRIKPAGSPTARSSGRCRRTRIWRSPNCWSASSGAREKNLQVREKKNLQVREKKIFRWEEQPLVHNCGPRLPKWELGGRRGLCSRSKPPSEQIRQISTALFFIHLNAAVFSIAVLLRWPPTKSSGCSPISLFIPQDIRISLPGDATNSCEVAWCSHPWCGLAQKCCSHSSFFPLY